MDWYLIGQKIVGQNSRNFGLVSKILSDEKFCTSKILSNISIQKSGNHWTKLSKFRLGVENSVRRNILSDENFVTSNWKRRTLAKFLYLLFVREIGLLFTEQRIFLLFSCFTSKMTSHRAKGEKSKIKGQLNPSNLRLDDSYVCLNKYVNRIH